ncbi:hydroxyacid dehydrogenase [Candidatus Pacearchaeota archaeon]|nr:hydroxyacid dehydrogenase [Candidatus Pacearchaeota archaeon]
MKKAIYFRVLNYTKSNLALIESYFDCITLNDPSEIDEEILRDAVLLFAPLGFVFDKDIFASAPCLKVIASNTTSVPHINLDHAKRSGIKVFSLKDEIKFLNSITPTAEMTIALILSITRNLIPAVNSVKKGEWIRWNYGGRRMLSRMSIGIVGLGRLGKMVANYTNALGMEIYYYDPYVEVAENFLTRLSSLEELVAKVDIISVHAHATPETVHMFNEKIFSQFKKGSFFINTSRGELVVSEALIQALGSGIVGGAALDVLDGEFEMGFSNNTSVHPLVQYSKEHDNLVITPHVGGSTEDAWHLTQRYVITQAISHIYGNPFDELIDFDY